jgi:hypothetical protein
MRKRTVSIEIIEEDGVRYLVSHYSNGDVARKEIDLTKRMPRRKPRLRRQKIRPKNQIKDRTRKKRF